MLAMSKLRRLRSIAMKGNFLWSRSDSHTAALLPLSEISVSQVSGVANLMRLIGTETD